MRFENIIQSIDLDIQDIIVNGPHIPTKIVDCEKHVKTKVGWDDKDKKLIQLNHKVVTAILCALNEDEFNRVTMCSSIKEIWNTLEKCYECTSQVKKSKIIMLILDYELFKVKD